MSAPDPRPDRHPRRTSRRLRLAALLLCPTFGPIACAPDADDLQDQAVATIKAFKGKVQRDTSMPGKPVIGVELLGPEITEFMVAKETILRFAS